MKRAISLIILAVTCALGTPSFAEGYVPVICPTPAESHISATDYSPVKGVLIETADADTSLSWARAHLRQWYGELAPEVKVKKTKVKAAPEEYALDIRGGEVHISASSLKGVRNALYSLRQIAIPARGTMTVQGWIVPEASVRDCPAMGFRGVHLCWFPETEAADIEKMIRLAAYYKLNHVVIESWGTFKSEVAPWFGWPDGKMTKEEIVRLRGIADDLGVCLVPQLNVFGHASGSRIRTGKHAILDFDQRYQPLFEPEGGWNWCLSNPETLRFQESIIGEMMDAFGNPPYFHIGCDEAEAPSCPDCVAVPYHELVLKHLRSISEYLSSRGARAMMWHDMLLKRGDERWEGFYANGTDYTAKALEDLPRNIVICDWFYGPAAGSYPTLDYFNGLGFDVLSCPWDDAKGIQAQGRYASATGLHGVLGTTWHHFYGTRLAETFSQLAESCWNKDPQLWRAHYNSMLLMVATHLRQIGWDMKQKEYRHAGWYDYQVIVEPDGDRVPRD